MDISLKLLLAVILSGIIGIERESIKRPAGFRTHILVCMGSTLVMIVGMHMAMNSNFKDVDPTRIGAQVISGIGFLGAGTIIKEGVSVKGLTTAASLWAVACVGLAIGAGFYYGAIIASLVIFITLLLFSHIESRFLRNDRYLRIRIITHNKPGQLGNIGNVTGELNLSIISISFNDYDESKKVVDMILKINDKEDIAKVISRLSEIEHIVRVTQK